MSWLSSSLKLENLPIRPMNPEDDNETKRYERREVAAEWRVPIHGKCYRIEFEHGTTSGKRIIWINGEEILRRDWMFKLVGEDIFQVEGLRCIIRVDPAPGFKYNYLLYVDGKPFKQYTERQAKALKQWLTTINGKEYNVVLERDTMNIFLNNQMREEVGEFVDSGTDTEFIEDNLVFILRGRGTGNRYAGIKHSLTVNGVLVPEIKIE